MKKSGHICTLNIDPEMYKNTQQSLEANRDFLKRWQFTALLLTAKLHNNLPLAAFPLEIIWTISCSNLEPVSKPRPLSFFAQKILDPACESIAPADSCVIF